MPAGLSATISPPVTASSKSAPQAVSSSRHSAMERGPSVSVAAAGPPPASAFAPKSKDSSWTCRLPALAPDAWRLVSPRSTTSTSRPACVR